MVSIRFKLTWWPALVHSLRTAVAAVVSLLVARLFRLPGTWWAPITTLVITQSSLGAALKVSTERFIGTTLGALVGGLVASYLPTNVAVFGGCIFVLGLVCALAHSGDSAYRFGGIAAAIVLLLPRSYPAWLTAFHRFAEVSIGIAVALILAWIWPEREAISGDADRPKTDSHTDSRSKRLRWQRE
jgi:uncharacterized membrane protein YgaE (UPF0421/DUF939 family)